MANQHDLMLPAALAQCGNDSLHAAAGGIQSDQVRMLLQQSMSHLPGTFGLFMTADRLKHPLRT
ncbi:hypothetical protein D3C71_1815570 [compost metagenome]